MPLAAKENVMKLRVITVALTALTLPTCPTTGPGSSAAADHTYPVSGAASSAAADRDIQDSRTIIEASSSRRPPAPYLPSVKRPAGS